MAIRFKRNLGTELLPINLVSAIRNLRFYCSELFRLRYLSSDCQSCLDSEITSLNICLDGNFNDFANAYVCFIYMTTWSMNSLNAL